MTKKMRFVAAVLLMVAFLVLPGMASADCVKPAGCDKCFAQHCHSGFPFGECTCTEIG